MKTESKMAALFVFNGDPVCFIHVWTFLVGY
jgi:hypothetical protein